MRRFSSFSGVELLPNHGQFSSLSQNLQRVYPTLNMAATIAAESFNLAAQRAAAADAANFQKYFSRGVAEAAKLQTAIQNSAVSAMFGWLMAAQNHASRIGVQHLQRTPEQQAKYAEGKQAAEASHIRYVDPVKTQQELVAQEKREQGSVVQAVKDWFSPPATSPPPATISPPTPTAASSTTTTSAPTPTTRVTTPQAQQTQPTSGGFTNIAAGISSLLNPLATAGASAYQAQQQASIARAMLRAGQTPPPSSPLFFMPQQQQSNTPLILALAGSGIVFLIVVYFLLKN